MEQPLYMSFKKTANKSSHADTTFSAVLGGGEVLVKTQPPKLFSSFRYCKNTTLSPHTQNQSIPTRKVVFIVMMPSSETFSFPLAHRLLLASES